MGTNEGIPNPNDFCCCCSHLWMGTHEPKIEIIGTGTKKRKYVSVNTLSVKLKGRNIKIGELPGLKQENGENGVQYVLDLRKLALGAKIELTGNIVEIFKGSPEIVHALCGGDERGKK